MSVSVPTACLLASALVFVTGASDSVFFTDQLYPTFKILGQRRCLPDDFDGSSTMNTSLSCKNIVYGENLPNECQAVSPLALFYDCYAYSAHLNSTGPVPSGEELQEAIVHLFDEIKLNKLEWTEDSEWVDEIFGILNDCEDHVMAGMTLRQSAVYAYLCFKWSLFAACDHQQDMTDSLDDAGALRRASFLGGGCPLSPNTLGDVLERVTSRTIDQCNVSTPTNSSAQMMYEAGIDKVLCLLDDFQIDDMINFFDLDDAINIELSDNYSEDAETLLSILHACDGSESSRDFVKCWAELGVFSCVYQEANEVAAEFPDTCELP